MKLLEQLLRDITASAPTSVMLGLSLLVGLSFWVPPVVRAFSGSPTVATKTPRDSTEMVRRLKECLLLPSANIDERPIQPFGIDDEQFPLPVLFTEDSEAESRPDPVVAEPQPVDRLDGLLLKSTIVGSSRRAALINNRLFQEGQAVRW